MTVGIAGACASVLFVCPAAAAPSHISNLHFAQWVYQDLLQHAGPPAQVEAYANQLDSGAPRAQVARALVSTLEFRRRMVTHYYGLFLGRPVDAGGLALAGSSAPLGQIAIGILASPEYFTSKGGTNKALADALYVDVVGRLATSVDQQVLVSFLQGDTHRPFVIGQLWNGTEAARHRVNEYAQSFLGRPVDPASASALAALLKGGGSEEDVIAAIVASAQDPTGHVNFATNGILIPHPKPSATPLTSVRAPAGQLTMSNLIPDAAFVEQSAPLVTPPGAPLTMTITFENTGSTTWDPAHYQLMCADGIACPWRPRAARLGSVVRPGGAYEFKLLVTSPATPGAYLLQWRMARDGKVFGAPSDPLSIRITSQ